MSIQQQTFFESTSHHETAVRAYFLWQQAGCPDGHDDLFWYQAETDIEIEARDARKFPAWEDLPKFHVSG